MATLAAELEGLPVGVLHVNLNAEILALNRCLRGWLGLANEDSAAWVGLPVDQLLSRPGRVLYHTHLLPTLRLHGEVQELSLALRAPSGTVHVLCSARLLERPEGPIAQLVLSPMRERLRIEAELARVQRAADAAPLSLFECVRDANGRSWIGYASAGLISLYGITPESVHFSDAPWLEQISPDDRPALLASRDTSAERMTLWRCEFRARSGSGPWRIHRLLAQPYAEPDGRTVWYGAIGDVTDAATAAAAALERDAAERASRSKSEFLARMSHELRTPLNAVIGFSHLLGEDLRPSHPQLLQRVALIQAAGRHLLHLVDDVLDIGRIEAGQLRLHLAPVNLGPLVAQVCAELDGARQARGLELDVQVDDLPAVHADETRLRQVLTNLVSNAIKYTREQSLVQLRAHAEGNRVSLSVQDDGPGLSPSQRQQLFQPFNRLGAERSRVEGTGLGLVISRHLVESMGGELQLAESAGRGCCFEVTLPRAEAAAAPAAAAAPPSPALSSTTLRAGRRWELLYAEDNEVNALLMQAFLARYPNLVLSVAPSGAAALARARQQPPDLLLLDMSLPDMDGRTLLALMRAEPSLAHIPAVAVTAEAMPDERARALAAGFQGYWTKPLDLARLPGELDALLQPQQAAAAA